MSSLGEEIVMYRAKHDMTQGEFANIAKVSKQTVCYIENGLQNPSKLTEAKIRLVIDGGKK